MKFKTLFLTFVDRFVEKKTTTWAASLAYYTALSLAPLLMLFLLLSSQFSYDLKKSFLSEVHALMGNEAAMGIELIIQNAKSRPDLMSTSGIIGILTLLVSASLIFGELRSALNFIFDVDVDINDYPFLKSFWIFLKVRFFHMGLVLGFLFIMIVSLMVSTLISATLTQQDTPLSAVMNVVMSAALYIILFSVLFHYLPEKRTSWKRSFQGGAITALLFVIGKEVIGFYLGHGAISSTYGAAGSILVLLAWVYYSALIIFVGAHISFILHSHAKIHNNSPSLAPAES